LERLKTVKVAAALAAGIALGTSGCNLIQPQATLKQYSASDGINVNLGNVALRNLIIISNDGKTGNLVMGAVNTDSPVALHVEYMSAGKLADGHVVLPFSTQSTLFGTDGHTKVILEGINTEPGSLLEVSFSVGSKTATTLVPVLTSEQPEYAGLNPSSVLTITTH
jgi:hypothetical protein